MKTKETLVRVYTIATPDGSAVHRTEHMEVEIEWPGDRPKQWDGYGNAGQWVMSETAVIANVSGKGWPGQDAMGVALQTSDECPD